MSGETAGHRPLLGLALLGLAPLASGQFQALEAQKLAGDRDGVPAFGAEPGVLSDRVMAVTAAIHGLLVIGRPRSD